MLTVLSSDFLNLTSQHNVLPPESPFTAMRVSTPTLNLLITVVPTFINFKIFHSDNCPAHIVIITIASSNQQSNTNPSAPPVSEPPSCSYSEATKQSIPKSHQLNSLLKNHKHKKPKNTPTQSLLLPNLQRDLVLLDNPPTLPHNQ